jgi:glycosyltransferase involved in cell wall biosynthesis
MNTSEAARAARHALGWGPERYVEVIPNGFDAADFAGRTSVRSNGAFRIVHTGYFHTELALRHADPSRTRELLGGTRAGVDFSGRTHMHLLTALERLIAEDAGLAERVELHLAGRLSAADLRVVERFEHRERVIVHGYLPHARSVELVRSADLLFFPMHDLPAGERSLIVPGKAYEYLASGRPVLAAVPDGDARDLMRSQAGVTVCRPLDVDGMAAALRAATAAHRAGRAPDAQRDLQRYERRQLTHRLAGVFDEVLGRRVG